MIRTGTVLDMDMSSLGTAVREGWDWWAGELAAMVPARLQPQGRKLSGPSAAFDAAGDLWLEGAALEPVAEDARRRLMPVVLPPAAAIATRTMLPRLAPRDLARMIALESDRLLPFPPGSAIAAARALSAEAQPGAARVPTLVAGMPQARAAALVASARECGIEPLALVWQSPEDEGLTIDLLPALVASGAVPARRDSRPFWWGVVAALFLANIGLMIWRDIAATNEFAAEVEAQAATGSAARALAERLAREAALRKSLIAERDAHDPLSLLALTAVALPEGAWVQRYSSTPESLRITGYKAPGSDIQTALRATGRFASLQTSVSDPTAEGGGGQPFDVSATLAGAPKPKEASQ